MAMSKEESWGSWRDKSLKSPRNTNQESKEENRTTDDTDEH